MVKNLWNLSSSLVPERLKLMGIGLDRWLESLRSNRTLMKRELQKRLQKLKESYPTDEVLEDTINVKLVINIEADKEEISWEQHARANWLKTVIGKPRFSMVLLQKERK